MKPFSYLITGWAMMTATLLLGSCAQMDTDLQECPSGLDVTFKYDYNIQRADMFNDHVGGISLYAFDENNQLVLHKDTANTALTAPLRQNDFTWHISESELPVGRYRIAALAYQKDYNETLATPGAKLRQAELNPGDDITKLQVTLDREATDATSATAWVDHKGCPLDTLWATRNLTADNDWVTIKPQKVSQHQISLLRDTKQVNITLRQTVDPSNMDDADYDVKVYDTNGRLLYNNEPDATDTRLCYTPYTQWTTTLGTRAEGETANLMHTAHYELMMNRLVAHQNNEADARLLITNKRTGKEVANVNLPALLADGRRAYERYNYSAQEYLDREYQFALDFYLVGDKWQYISVSIAALSWSYRVQNVEL